MFWRDFTEFVAKCADQWTDQFTQGTTACFAGVFEEQGAQLFELSGTRDTGVVESGMLKNEARLNDGDVPTKRAEVPTVGGALMQYLRTNVMMVSMVGMMFGGLFTLQEPVPRHGPSLS